MKCSLGISNFPEEISSLSRSVVFLYFFALIAEECFLISSCYSLELCIQMGISFLFSFSSHFSSFLSFLRPPQAAILPFCISFSWRWSWSLPPIQCHKPPFIVLQVLCLSDLILKSICHFHRIIIRDLISVIPEWSSSFPYFLQFKSKFCTKDLMIWVTASSQSCFCWLYRASPSLAAKNIINLISVLTIWWCPCVESSLLLLEEGICYDQCVLLAKLY